MKNRAAMVTMLVGALAGGALAQESSLRAEREVEWQIGRAVDLKATVGPVRVHSVEFSDLGRGYGQGGIGGRLRPAPTTSEASTTLRGHFLVENPNDVDWEVTFTLEFLDRSGAVIEKVTRKANWEGEAKPYNFDHPLLAYVVPMIDKVRIKLEGRLD